MKLPWELVEKRGSEAGPGREWRGTRWPRKKISLAGDRSIASATSGGECFVLLSCFARGWRVKVKENSCDGDDDGEDDADTDAAGVRSRCTVCFVDCTFG